MSSLSSSSRRQRLARHVLAVSLALASGLSVHAAWGQAAAAHYDVPAGPLAEALTRYARAAAAVLSFDPAHLRGCRPPD